MIPGYEDITCEVNEEEIEMAKEIARAFSVKYIGKENAVSGAKIIASYKKNRGYNLNDGRLRKIIQYIRLNCLTARPLLASAKGYYIARNDEELKKWLITMDKRIRQTQYTRDCVKFFSIAGNQYKEI